MRETAPKIGFVATSAKMGGAANYLRELIPAWADDDAELNVLGPEDVSQGRLSVASRVVFPSFRSGDHDVLVYSANFLPLLERRPSVLLVRNPIYFSARYSRRVGRTSASGAVALTLRRWLCVSSIRRATVVVCPSRSVKDQVMRYEPDAASQMIVLPHIAPEIPLLKSSAVEADGVYVATPAFHKNYRVLLIAARVLQNRGWRGHLHLIGDGSDRFSATARRLARRLGVEERVIWHALARTGAGLHELAAVALNPSLEESFGFTYSEAVAKAERLVATDLPIARERVGHAAGVSFVDGEDWMAWADGMTLAFNGDAAPNNPDAGASWTATAARLQEIVDVARVMHGSRRLEWNC